MLNATVAQHLIQCIGHYMSRQMSSQSPKTCENRYVQAYQQRGQASANTIELSNERVPMSISDLTNQLGPASRFPNHQISSDVA